MSTTDQAHTLMSPARLVVRGLVALALLVDAVVHLHLAPGYQLSAPSGVGAGNLFRLESAVALAAAALVLVRGNRPSYAAAFLVGLSAVAEAFASVVAAAMLVPGSSHLDRATGVPAHPVRRDSPNGR